MLGRGNRIEQHLPHVPYVADYNKIAFKTSKENALNFPLVQVNPKCFCRYLLFDIDYNFNPQKIAHIPPNWIAYSKNGRCHIGYELEVPVSSDKTGKATRWAAAIEAELTKILRADPSYGKWLTKNPVSLVFWHVENPRKEPYSLKELHDLVKPPKPRFMWSERKEKTIRTGLGRNCETFEAVRFLGYSRVEGYRKNCDFSGFFDFVYDACDSYQDSFTFPLADKEVKCIASSISSWTWDNYQGGGNTKNRGVMAAKFHPDMNLKEKQVSAAHYSAKLNADSKKLKVWNYVEMKRKQGVDVSKAAVAKATKISRPTVIKHWPSLKDIPLENHTPLSRLANFSKD